MWQLLFWGVLFGVNVPQRALAQEGETGEVPKIPSHLLEAAGYSVDYWSAEDGFPVSQVSSIVQSPDGYLWCASYQDGVVRFDGQRFTEFRINEPSSAGMRHFTRLSQDSQGRLWVGVDRTELYVFEKGVFRRLGTEDGMPLSWNEELRGNLLTFGRDDDGGIWACKASPSPAIEIVRFHADRVEVVAFPRNKFSRLVVGDVAFGEDGNIRWVIPFHVEPELYEVTSDGIKRRILERVEGERPTIVGRFFRSNDGTLSFASDLGIYGLGEDGWRLCRSFPVRLEFHKHITTACQDIHGNYWITTNTSKLYLSRGEGLLEEIQLPERFDLQRITTITTDSDGNVWVASHRALHRIRPTVFRSWTARHGLAGSRGLSVVEDSQHRTWITTSKGIHSLGPGETTVVRHSVDGGDLFWLATPARQGGVYAVRPNPLASYTAWRMEHWTREGGRQIAAGEGRVLNLLESGKGILWIATTLGLLQHQEGETRFVSLPVGDPQNQVSAVEEDLEGRLVVALQNHGVLRSDGKAWHRLSPLDAPLSKSIHSIYADAEGCLWFGGPEGLSLWQEGTWHDFSGAPGVPVNAWGLVSDSTGSLWMMSDEGLLRIRRDLLLRWVRDENTVLSWERFDRAQGLDSRIMGPVHARLWQDDGGRILIPTVLGVSSVDPVLWDRRKAEIKPPPIRIEALHVDGVDVPLHQEGDDPMIVGPGSEVIDFHYTSINLSKRGQNYYRHRLVGYQDDWIEVDDARMAIFRGLPPGRYRFEVSSGDSSGRWSPASASVSFKVEPFWWQRWEVRSAAVLATVIAVILLIRLARRIVLSRQARREEFSRQLIATQEEERKRIASELHDGLGQDLLVLKNGIHTAEKAVADNDRQRVMGTIKDVVSQSVTDVRTIARNLHPLQLERLGLSKTIESTVIQAADTSGLEIGTTVEDIDGIFSPDIEIGIYRIVQEALNNIMKHSGASQAKVAVEMAEQGVVIEVEDNGRGFNAKEMLRGDRESGKVFGLWGKEERCRMAGGRVTIHSEPGKGTRMRVDLPFPQAMLTPELDDLPGAPVSVDSSSADAG